LAEIYEPHGPRRDFAPAEFADVEADPAWPGQRDQRARGKTLVGFKRRRPSRYVPIKSEEAHASDRRPPPRAEQAGSEAAVSPGRRSNSKAAAGLAASLHSNEDNSSDTIDEPHVPRRDFAPAELADVEADPAWPGQRDKRARGKTLVGFKRSRPSRY
jgi:hypothetical protein